MHRLSGKKKEEGRMTITMTSSTWMFRSGLILLVKDLVGPGFLLEWHTSPKERESKSKREMKTIRPHLDAAAHTLNQRFTFLLTLALLLVCR